MVDNKTGEPESLIGYLNWLAKYAFVGGWWFFLMIVALHLFYDMYLLLTSKLIILKVVISLWLAGTTSWGYSFFMKKKSVFDEDDLKKKWKINGLALLYCILVWSSTNIFNDMADDYKFNEYAKYYVIQRYNS